MSDLTDAARQGPKPTDRLEEAEVVAPSRWKAIWDADIFYSFRRSPVAVIAAIVTLVMVLDGG